MRNFRVYVDRDGKMPQLRRGVWDSASHPYYTRYVADKPVALRGPVSVLADDVTGTRVWDYSKNEYVPAASLPQE
jgi:hypothetical protein